MANFSFVPPTATASKPAVKKKRVWLWLVGILGSLALMVIIGLMVGISWYNKAISEPAQPSGSLVSFTIESGQSVDQIASSLKQVGLVKDTQAFGLYVRLSGNAAKLQSGNFQIPQHISIKDVVAKLQKGGRDEATLRFVEGWRREEMAEYLNEQHSAGAIDMTGDQFSELALNPSQALRAQLGNILSADDSLQGFLFPDTYVINRDETAEGLLSKMINTYKSRVTSDIVTGFQKHNLTTYQAIILASIVERESKTGEERNIIAGILLNRLDLGMTLGVDATMQYALGYSESENRWWRHNLTTEDLAIDSPYNTRLYAGLPPHPICNPSLTAIRAVAQPTDTDYLFYIHGTDGKPYYAKTLAEHNANIAKYLR